MGSKDGFVHLHVHTDYSKLDGMQTVDEVAKFVAADGQPAVAFTDHGNMNGFIKAEQACEREGIRAIPGYEAYHVDSYARVVEERDSSRDHMILLAVNDEGYRNLLQMSSFAYTDQNYYKPLIDDALLSKHSSGLVATSGCIGSPIGQALLRGDTARARDLLAMYRDMMEPGHYFAEVQVHDFEEQTRVNRLLVPLAKDLGIPLVATQDAHYVHEHNAIAHEYMLAVQTGKPLSDPSRFKFSSHTNYMTTAQQMRQMVPEDLYPGACDNTLLIAEMAQDVTKKVGANYLIPSFPDADQFGGERAMLRHLVFEGARARYGDPLPSEVTERLEYELSVIHDMGFDAYFLIVWDMVKWAKDQGIYVGPGRGSAAGSAVSYCLNITTLDPIHYGLYFERFLNPGRKSMPDIDIDFEKERRGEVRLYLREKYGSDRVAFIATQGKYHGRSSIQAAARLFDLTPSEGQALSSVFPQNTKLSIEQMLAPNLRALDLPDDPDKREAMEQAWDEGRAFRLRVNRADINKRVAEAAADFEGYIKNFGIHAAGVLITPEPLTNFVPVTTETSDKSLVVCGYDKDDVEAIGGLKMDLLGLVNLTTIRKCVEQVRDNHGIDLDLENLPLDDPKTFALLQNAETEGVFQLGSTGIRDLVGRVSPTTFEDLSATIALYRPGPMGTEMHLDYANRKNGRARVEVDHPDVLKVTADTFGVVCYQEQLLALAQVMAGFTAAEADTLRKATGKKDAALLAAQEAKFKQGMIDNGYSEQLADRIWSRIPSFAEYSFNKAHSAAYAMVAYQTAYLKANYTAEYAAACVDTLADPVTHMRWAKAMGITFDVPDVNLSAGDARAVGDTVRLGLNSIKGLGEIAANAIVQARLSGGPFRDLNDFLARTAGKVTAAGLTALVEAGALDSLWPSRGALLDKGAEILAQARQYATSLSKGAVAAAEGFDLFEDIVIEPPNFCRDLSGEETLRLSERTALQVNRLGVFLGDHPLAMFERHLSGRIPAAAERLSPDVALGDVYVYGVVTSVQSIQTRTGKTITTVMIESDSGMSVPVKIFDADDEDVKRAGVGALLAVTGTLREDEWARTRMLEEGQEEVEAPREIVATDWKVFPLAMLDSVVSGASDDYNILITVPSVETLRRVAARLRGQLRPGSRLITVRLDSEDTSLPQRVSDSLDDVDDLVGDLDGVTVTRA